MPVLKNTLTNEFQALVPEVMHFAYNKKELTPILHELFHIIETIYTLSKMFHVRLITFIS